jgi:hypothetical protein
MEENSKNIYVDPPLFHFFLLYKICSIFIFYILEYKEERDL